MLAMSPEELEQRVLEADHAQVLLRKASRELMDLGRTLFGSSELERARQMAIARQQ